MGTTTGMTGTHEGREKTKAIQNKIVSDPSLHSNIISMAVLTAIRCKPRTLGATA